MISEALNALFLTYLVSEYLAETNHDGGPLSRRDWTQRFKQTHVAWCGLALLAVNLVERNATVAAPILKESLHRFLHLPKVVLIMTLYVVALYADCRRSCPSLRLQDFAKRIGVAFCHVLPVYPLLAIAISFGFLLLINLFEFLRLPLELLNWPIYYGTLYGPFSLIYWDVKRRILDEKLSLPVSR
jgi:hypothetical protein